MARAVPPAAILVVALMWGGSLKLRCMTRIVAVIVRRRRLAKSALCMTLAAASVRSMGLRATVILIVSAGGRLTVAAALKPAGDVLPESRAAPIAPSGIAAVVTLIAPPRLVVVRPSPGGLRGVALRWGPVSLISAVTRSVIRALTLAEAAVGAAAELRSACLSIAICELGAGAALLFSPAFIFPQPALSLLVSPAIVHRAIPSTARPSRSLLGCGGPARPQPRREAVIPLQPPGFAPCSGQLR